MQDALFCTVLRAMRTVLHCFTCGIITLQEPQGIGARQHPAAFVLPGCDRGTHICRPIA
nr:MAG TPA: hypothetical protein [Caudoviricetes sp.]